MNPGANPSPSSAERPGWRGTVFATCASVFISFIGFSAALPFAAFFIQQELGVSDPKMVKLYTVLFAAATPVPMALLAPVWGALGDRTGRRTMLMRANFGVGATIFLMGFCTGVWQLLALRLLQGIFSGTQVAAQTLATSEAPPERTGSVIGALTAVLFAGNLMGSAMGGELAERFDCRFVFKLAGALSLLAGVLVLFFVRERHGSAAPGKRVAGAKLCHATMRRVVLAAVPLLVAMFVASLARSVDKPMIPLLVQKILGTVEGAMASTGRLMALGAVAGFLAGIGGGWLADRVKPARLVLAVTLLSAVTILPLAFVGKLAWVFPVFFVASLASCALEPALQNWLVRETPENLRGTIIGWTATARAAGWSVAPLIAGFFAIQTGLASVFVVTAFCFLSLVPLVFWAGKK